MAEAADDATVLHVGGAAPYDVVVGWDLVERLPGVLGPAVQRVGLVVAQDLLELANPVLEVLNQSYEVALLLVPDGERAKGAEVVALCWDALGSAGLTRSDAVVTVGGGATTDVGGFVAATWLRGVRVVHVTTTLLGMVDAAVGGKTGINTEAGKNLVGAFHEPAGVLCDLALLDSLPAEEIASGMAEVVKCGFIADPEILRLVDGADSLTPGSPVLRELVERAIRVKIDVVVADLRESGGADGHPGREVLNYGHTLGHAVERAEDYRIRHGEAVAIGCVYAAELARLAGRLDPEVVERHRTALARVGLPTSIAGYSGADFDTLHAIMKLDKKARGSQLRFLVLDDIAAPAVLTGPDEADLREAFRAIGGRA